MSNQNINTPILFLVFNRPEQTKYVFEAIRKIKPKYLFIAADGARTPSELEVCKYVREIATNIDWECQVKTLFREKNLGCKYAVSSAISWFFEHVEQGIILEDDCLPNESFFIFCQELLNKYKYSSKIMHITGTNLNDNLKFGDGSYYYSKYPHIWGWATWRRAWQKYDLELHDDVFYTKLVKSTFKHFSERNFWTTRLVLLKKGEINTWDYQWMFSIWKEDGVCLNTNYNFIENIGFGPEATHTTGPSNYISTDRKTHIILEHPTDTSPIENAEAEFLRTTHGIERIGNLNYFLKQKIIMKMQITVKTFLKKLHKLWYYIKMENKIEKTSLFFLKKYFPTLYKFEASHSVAENLQMVIINSNISSTANVLGPAELINVKISDHTYVSKNSNISFTEIGKFCSIGPNLLCGWGIHPTNGLSTSPIFYSMNKQTGFTFSNHNKIEERLPIHIGNDVFIGMNVTILDGVEIGDGAIIGAGAVVSKNIPAYAIAFGSPIQISRYRFKQEIIEELIKIKWWDFEQGELKDVEKYFLKIEEFISKYKSSKCS